MHLNHQNMCRSSEKNGFTLIEVLFSILILAIALIGMIALVGVIVKGNTKSKAVTTATTIAQDRLEDLIRMDYDAVIAGAGTNTWNITIYDKTYNLIERLYVGTPTASSSTLEVEVYWGSGTSTTHNVVELQTIISLE